MTGITLSTVGYGDILNVESSLAGIVFTMTLMIIGMGAVVYAVSNATAFIVEGNLKNIFLAERAKRRAKKMKDHYIICGAGRTGIHVVREMAQTKQNFVVIDQNQDLWDEMSEEFPSAVFIAGDVTDDDVLKSANIESAKGLVVSLSNDKDNLYLVVTAKMLNPDITIVARAVSLEITEKLKKAGANYVVSPNFIGGLRIASEILRPHVVSFLDKMLRAEDKSIRVEECKVPTNHSFVGKKMSEINFYGKTGVQILATSQGNNVFEYNPAPDHILKEDEVLLFIATTEQRTKMEKLFHDQDQNISIAA
jgi:voltage-gated potassium channel